jgi:hypothetical protein
VGERNRDRQLVEARLAYVAAVRRLDSALRRFDGSGIAMDPGPGREPIPWTHEQVQIILAVSQGFREVIDRRRSWDQLRREWHPSH